MSTLPHERSIETGLEMLARRGRQEEEMKGTQTGAREAELAPFTHDVILENTVIFIS